MPYNFLPIAHVHFRTLSRENSHCGSIFSAGGGALFLMSVRLLYLCIGMRKIFYQLENLLLFYLLQNIQYCRSVFIKKKKRTTDSITNQRDIVQEQMREKKLCIYMFKESESFSQNACQLFGAQNSMMMCCELLV